jgi:hypothetical protein
MNITVSIIHECDDMEHKRSVRFEDAQAGFYEARFITGEDASSITMRIVPAGGEPLKDQLQQGDTT